MSIPLNMQNSIVQQISPIALEIESDNQGTLGHVKVSNVSQKIKEWTSKINDAQAKIDKKGQLATDVVTCAWMSTVVAIISCISAIIFPPILYGLLPFIAASSLLTVGMSVRVRKLGQEFDELKKLQNELPDLADLCSIDATVKELLNARRSKLNDQRISAKTA